MYRSNAVGAAWTVVLYWSRFGINSIVFLTIARWITPAEVGAYGAVFAVVQILQAVQLSGLPEAVIRSEDPESAYTAFWLSVGLGVLMAMALNLSAPVFGFVFGAPAKHFATALSIVPFVIGVGAVSEAALRREMLIDRLALRSTATLVTAGVITVALAAHGWGGWALIAFTVVNNISASLLNLMISPWKPAMRLDRRHLPRLIADALTISGNSVLKSLVTPMSQFIVTGLLGLSAGGIYLIAVRFSGILYSLTMMPAQFAALTIFTRMRSDAELRRSAFIEATAVMSVLASPIYIGTAAISPTILPLVLGEVGHDVVPVAQGLLFHTPALVLVNLGLPALVSIGFARSALVFTAIQVIINLPLTVAAAMTSVSAVGWSYGVLYYAILPLLLRYLRDKAGIDTNRALRAVIFPWLAALLMGAVVWSLRFALPQDWSPFAALTVQICIGLFTYMIAVLLLARSSFQMTILALSALRNR